MPSGTRVEIQIVDYVHLLNKKFVFVHGQYLDITITPSLNDWNQVEGKCGTYNDIRTDDFTDRKWKHCR